MPLNLRFAEPRDVPEILGLIREIAAYEKLSHEVVADEARLEAELFGPRPSAEVLLAELDGAVAGYALFFHNFSTFVGRKGLYLEDIFVRPAHRRQGVGRRIFARLLEIARERGCGRMEWTVLDWNQPARDFYAELTAREMSEWILMRLDREGMERAQNRLAAQPGGQTGAGA